MAIEEAALVPRSAAPGCEPRARDALVFTSGGTEAANLAFGRRTWCGSAPLGGPLDLAGRFGWRARIRPCRQGHRFQPATGSGFCQLDDAGVVDLGVARKQCSMTSGRRPGERVMLALQAANNETGVVQPVRAAADLVHARGGVVVLRRRAGGWTYSLRYNDARRRHDVYAVGA